jgi:hypothetical protein
MATVPRRDLAAAARHVDKDEGAVEHVDLTARHEDDRPTLADRQPMPGARSKTG